MGSEVENYDETTATLLSQLTPQCSTSCVDIFLFEGESQQPKASCVMNQDNRCARRKWSDSGAKTQRGGRKCSVLFCFCFLPDRFLYRAAGRTVVRFLGGGGGRVRTRQNKTTQHVNHRQICAGGANSTRQVILRRRAASGGPVRSELVYAA